MANWNQCFRSDVPGVIETSRMMCPGVAALSATGDLVPCSRDALAGQGFQKLLGFAAPTVQPGDAGSARQTGPLAPLLSHRAVTLSQCHPSNPSASGELASVHPRCVVRRASDRCAHRSSSVIRARPTSQPKGGSDEEAPPIACRENTRPPGPGGFNLAGTQIRDGCPRLRLSKPRPRPGSSRADRAGSCRHGRVRNRRCA